MFDFFHSIKPLYSVSGFIVGSLVGFTGVGGGSLMTPLLVLVFGIAPTTAVGTDLLYAAITKSSGTIVHGLNGTIDWPVTRRLASGSVPATIATLASLSWLGGSGHEANGLITTSLGFALLLTAIVILFRESLLNLIARHTDGLSDRQTRTPHHSARRLPRYSRVDFFGRRRRHRHDGADRPLSTSTDGSAGRV